MVFLFILFLIDFGGSFWGDDVGVRGGHGGDGSEQDWGT